MNSIVALPIAGVASAPPADIVSAADSVDALWRQRLEAIRVENEAEARLVAAKRRGRTEDLLELQLEHERAGDVRFEIDWKILDAPATIDQAAAALLIGVFRNHGSDETPAQPGPAFEAAMLSLPGLKDQTHGAVRESIVMLLDNPDRRPCELGIFPGLNRAAPTSTGQCALQDLPACAAIARWRTASERHNFLTDPDDPPAIDDLEEQAEEAANELHAAQETLSTLVPGTIAEAVAMVDFVCSNIEEFDEPTDWEKAALFKARTRLNQALGAGGLV